MNYDEASAKQYGVVIVHLLPCGTGQEHCVALNFLTGKLYREGHPLWVHRQLVEGRVKLVAEYGASTPPAKVTTAMPAKSIDPEDVLPSIY